MLQALVCLISIFIGTGTLGAWSADDPLKDLVDGLRVGTPQKPEDWLSVLLEQPDGTVVTLATEVDGQPFLGPNFAAVDRAGNAYFSDPCLDAIFRVTPEGTVTKWLDVPEPNGFAFSADESELWVVSENKDLLCFFRIDDQGLERRGDLMRVPLVDGEPAGPVEFVEEDVGNFGDGIAFDVEGNLYMVFDLLDISFLGPIPLSIRLESGVWVRTPEGDFQKWFSSLDTVWANVAFGEGAFASTDLYLTEFLPDNRIFRTEVGIDGLPLLH
ncbi:MAG: SMP-30/gluconolactonase/LRE family protein [Myxococcales bacterium]|nr:SMP-30/gluconolactonase/LRE family protein [Myxococcales bacterium]